MYFALGFGYVCMPNLWISVPTKKLTFLVDRFIWKLSVIDVFTLQTGNYSTCFDDHYNVIYEGVGHNFNWV